jgi:hypothetical protein
MHSHTHSTNPSPRSLPSIFSPAFLALLRERDEVLTAAEAEYAGPWKREPAARIGQPGAVAVLRDWEDLDRGDTAEGVFWHDERARLFAVLLPALEREPLFHLSDKEEAAGYPLLAMYGEQGPQVAGWLKRCEPHLAEGLHLFECLVRSPAALADLLDAAGPGACEQIGQILAQRWTR